MMRPPPRWRVIASNLSARDRRALGLLAVALGLFVYTFVLLRPLQGWADDATMRHASALADERAVAAVLAALGPQRHGATVPPTPETLAAEARAAGLQVGGASPDGEGRVRLDLSPGSPELLFQWLDASRDGAWVVVEAEVVPEGDGIGASLLIAPRA